MRLATLLVTFLIAGGIFAVTTRTASAILIDEYGQIYTSDGQVLGRGSDDNENDGDDDSAENEIEDTLDQMERELNTLDANVRTDTNQGEIRTEVRFSDDARAKTRVENDRTKTEVRQESMKVRLEKRNGEAWIKVENEETGEEEDLPVETNEDNEILEIRERTERDSVTVSTSGDQFVIRRNDVGALAHFPLSVDLSTNTLTVTTPGGEKAVTILPDQAVQNMLAANVIDQVGGSTFTALVQENPDLSFGQIVRLIQTQQGALAYEVPGIKQQRLLGFIPVVIETTAVVSAETGELLTTRSSFVNQLLDLVSF